MANVEIELDSAGIRELLQSAGMMQICASHAKSGLSACGEGYEVDTYVGKTRVNAMLRAVTPAAKADNAKNHTIEKAIRAMK